MSVLKSKKLNYIVIMAIVIVVILAVFDTIFTFKIHNRLVQMTSKPRRWPAGAYVYDRKIGFDFAPGQSCFMGDYSFYVKSHQLGYRIGQHEDSIAYQPGGILSLGCSFTYGDEVESEQTFTQIAADSLGIPAYNYGVCSFSYIHALLKAQKLKKEGVLDKLKPEYVVLGCWNGLPDRSRTPFPPLASHGLPFPTAYLAEEGGNPRIHYPMGLQTVYNLVDLYRTTGSSLSIGKFIRIFIAVPRIVVTYIKYNRMVDQVRGKAFRNDVSDFEIYDYYFKGIEDVFSDYGSHIIVLFMPHQNGEKPGMGLEKALAAHPRIIFVNGMDAIQKYEVPTGHYQARHPQPDAHMAYAREIVERIRMQGD